MKSAQSRLKSYIPLKRTTLASNCRLDLTLLPAAEIEEIDRCMESARFCYFRTKALKHLSEVNGCLKCVCIKKNVSLNDYAMLSCCHE
jgi:hypothetical protein